MKRRVRVMEFVDAYLERLNAPGASCGSSLTASFPGCSVPSTVGLLLPRTTGSASRNSFRAELACSVQLVFPVTALRASRSCRFDKFESLCDTDASILKACLLIICI